jgi:hypothetical protein
MALQRSSLYWASPDGRIYPLSFGPETSVASVTSVAKAFWVLVFYFHFSC